MSRFSGRSWDVVNVEIDDPIDQQPEIRQARFLESFTQRRSGRCLPLLEMPAHLQPPAQPAMAVQQQSPRWRIDDERAGSEMTRLVMRP